MPQKVCVGLSSPLLFGGPVFSSHFLGVEEPTPQSGRRGIDRAGTFSALKQTASNLRQYRVAWLFLLAYWLYIDGVDTIVRMAVDYGLSIGLPSESLIIAFSWSSLSAFRRPWCSADWVNATVPGGDLDRDRGLCRRYGLCVFYGFSRRDVHSRGGLWSCSRRHPGTESVHVQPTHSRGQKRRILWFL
ncbi:MAG: hypothetical protein CM1200mP18_23370 [Gammaproteobacteria bacterium]|nr:MAG: hypothetical protein CM1200mP18_23370 [Gammaproteobacteria bacterium]